jgi:glyoxylase I family protein
LGSQVHHTAICPTDFDASLRFYRDGLGMDVVMGPLSFDGDWPTLFTTTRASTLRSVFLGDPGTPDAGIVELVEFEGEEPGAAVENVRTVGFFLLSFFVNVEATIERLAGVGCHDVRRIEVPGPRGPVMMATVHDPDGVLVELIDRPQ